MKKIIFYAVLILGMGTSLDAFGQERLDSLYYLNGKIEAVSISKNNDKSIDCTYPGEDLPTTISKDKLLKIVFKSGRVEECNEPVVKEEVVYDQIIMANGEKILAKISKITDSSIEYTLPNESFSTVTSKNVISKVIFSNGRIEEFGSLLNIKVITSSSQWEDVVVSYNESDLIGLEKVGQISKASGWGGMLASGAGYNDAIKLCKKEAAKMGCGLIYIVDAPNRKNTRYGAGVRVNATAYRLPSSKKKK